MKNPPCGTAQFGARAAYLFWLAAGAGLLAACAHHHPAPTESYSRIYGQPLVSPGTKFAALPPTIQHTIRAEAGQAEIADINKYAEPGRTVYRVTFQNHYVYPPLYIAPDGSLLSQDLTVARGAPKDTFSILTGGPAAGVTLDELPSKVVKLIQQQAPEAEVDTLTKETHGEQVVYVVTFKNHGHTPLYITTDGTLLKAKPQ